MGGSSNTNDPFQTPAPGAMGTRHPAGPQREYGLKLNNKAVAAVAGLPVLLFIITSLWCSYGLMFTGFLWWTPWIWLVGSVGVCVFFAVSFVRNERMRVYFFFGITGMVGILLGAAAGFHAFHSFLSHVHSVSSFPVHTNVVPSDPGLLTASQLQVMQFTQGTHVNASMSSGVMVDGHRYCAAPVVEQGAAPGVVFFWAIGRDCCKARGGFTCDDALAANARYGVFYQDSRPARVSYTKAASESVKAFQLQTNSSDPFLLQFTADPSTLDEQYWSATSSFLLVVWLVYMLFSAAFGFLLYQASKRSGGGGEGTPLTAPGQGW
mmetsp:Transcript_33589/g.81223  ORF Transcript_33589/g.81223 Transcript_33589/m.81223 type:complete len:322 (+) Transcript_33589:113-1078(+)